jgi:hypothetical protein
VVERARLESEYTGNRIGGTRFNPTCRVRAKQEAKMPFKRTVLPNGFVLIDSYDITPEEELQMFNDFGGVNLFPSANHLHTPRRHT